MRHVYRLVETDLQRHIARQRAPEVPNQEFIDYCDHWKRSEMGKLADTYCDEVILTDEDPYDEDPNAIVGDVAKGISLKKPIVIMDRRLAIREAIKMAKKGDVILITGKGTDPYIVGRTERNFLERCKCCERGVR